MAHQTPIVICEHQQNAEDERGYAACTKLSGEKVSSLAVPCREDRRQPEEQEQRLSDSESEAEFSVELEKKHRAEMELRLFSFPQADKLLFPGDRLLFPGPTSDWGPVGIHDGSFTEHLVKRLPSQSCKDKCVIS